METQKFTLSIQGKLAIQKLESLGRKKGEYVSELINNDIRIEELERRVKELEGKTNVWNSTKKSIQNNK